MPVQRDWLIILLSGQETLPVISFNSFGDISSYPELDLGFNWPIILAKQSNPVISRAVNSRKSVSRARTLYP